MHVPAIFTGDHERLQASVHQEDVSHAHIINEAIVIHTDAIIGAVGTLLNGECEFIACTGMENVRLPFCKLLVPDVPCSSLNVNFSPEAE